jgi:DNA-binding MarR family transcriptional regulator
VPALMRRSAPEATVDDLRALLRVLRAFRQDGQQGNANRLPPYADAVLVSLALHADGRAMRELRAEFKVSHTSIGRTCRALARRGLVRISADPADRRRTLVKLTALGSRVIDGVLAAFRGSRTQP